MLDSNILLLLKQINICIGLYGMDQSENEHGLTFAQILLLNEIFEGSIEPQIYSKDLSEQMGVSRTTISVALKQLRKKGYVEMMIDTVDNRKKHIVLTSKGQKLEPVVKAYMNGLLQCLCRTVTDQDLHCTVKTLEIILTNIQQEIARRSFECNTR